MSDHFAAKTLLETRMGSDNASFELIFGDSTGIRQTISLPRNVAAELAPVLASLAQGAGRTGPSFTRMPKAWAVGSARHERLVLIRFDEDPPYALDVDEAQHLWREVREEAGLVAQLKAPVRQ